MNLELRAEHSMARHNARPCDIAWIRSIVEQCAAAGVACFVKQLGAHVIQDGERRRKKDRKGGAMEEWSQDLRVREIPIEQQAHKESQR